MSNHDIQLLAIGASFGMNAMLLAHVILGVMDDRRARKARRADEASLEAAQKRASS